MSSHSKVEGERDDEMSAYELQRLEHIRRNHEMLVRLGLVEDVIKKDVQREREEKRKARVARKRAREQAIGPQAPVSLRRSARLVGREADYTGDGIDRLVTLSSGSSAKRRRISAAGGSASAAAVAAAEEEGDDDERIRAEILKTTMDCEAFFAARFPRLSSPPSPWPRAHEQLSRSPGSS